MREGPIMPLEHRPHIPDADGFYEALIDAQRDLGDEEALQFQARLVLVLANHVGDREVLTEALAVARRGLPTR